MTKRKKQNPRDATATVSAAARDRAIAKALRPLERRIAALEKRRATGR
jgi:hypothetical protein